MNDVGRTEPSRHPAYRLLRLTLLLCLLQPTTSARATAGFAEYSWYFHYRPGQWIEWHHGDICPPDAPRKECVLLRQSKTVERRPTSPRPLPFGDGPQGLYLNTLLALMPLALGGFGLTRLWRRWQRREIDPSGWTLRSTWTWGLMTVLALAWMPSALAVLFPASPGTDGWYVWIGLSLNILIVASPATLWWTYRRLFPPTGRRRPGRWSRLLLWPALLLSGVFAPLLLWGPPNLLVFFFPPMLLPNIAVSLLVVWMTAKAMDAFTRRAM